MPYIPVRCDPSGSQGNVEEPGQLLIAEVELVDLIKFS
jgi:hypothetical protein